jgi:hypothetical protein
MKDGAGSMPARSRGLVQEPPVPPAPTKRSALPVLLVAGGGAPRRPAQPSSAADAQPQNNRQGRALPTGRQLGSRLRPRPQRRQGSAPPAGTLRRPGGNASRATRQASPPPEARQTATRRAGTRASTRTGLPVPPTSFRGATHPVTAPCAAGGPTVGRWVSAVPCPRRAGRGARGPAGPEAARPRARQRCPRLDGDAAQAAVRRPIAGGARRRRTRGACAAAGAGVEERPPRRAPARPRRCRSPPASASGNAPCSDTHARRSSTVSTRSGVGPSFVGDAVGHDGGPTRCSGGHARPSRSADRGPYQPCSARSTVRADRGVLADLEPVPGPRRPRAFVGSARSRGHTSGQRRGVRTAAAAGGTGSPDAL